MSNTTIWHKSITYGKLHWNCYFSGTKKSMGMAMFKRTFAGTIPDNLRALHMKAWDFEAKGQKVHPNFAPNITMEFHYHAFCTPEFCNLANFTRSFLKCLSQRFGGNEIHKKSENNSRGIIIVVILCQRVSFETLMPYTAYLKLGHQPSVCNLACVARSSMAGGRLAFPKALLRERRHTHQPKQCAQILAQWQRQALVLKKTEDRPLHGLALCQCHPPCMKTIGQQDAKEYLNQRGT